ncbi:AMP-binding protein [Leucobacter insecticola]|uniref:AMP-binding protein n=1 Tax=Leucobacter insecticola TaxID=2714934 RepID=A0A6G8FH93_9MICO|nr:AMP-binding protein [Leucobacter insecticola]QIM15724.1 AMP-binding protein [Leucobacter insecticola]
MRHPVSEIQLTSTPQSVDIEQVQNVTELLMRRLRDAPEHIAFELRSPGSPLDAPWTGISTREFAEQVSNLAKGLIASGVQAGDTVIIMAPTQYLWAVVDHAALFAGAVVVPVYDTASDAQLGAIIADAEPSVAFTGTAELRDRIVEAAEGYGAPLTTEAVWILDPETRSLDALTELGAGVTDAELESRRLAAELGDVATIVYTSGTTGDPKGALITHRNLVGQVLNTAAAYSEVVQESGNTVLFLPLTHVLGRALQLICIANGMRVAHLSDPKEVVQALAILKPTFLVVVPRVLEKIEAAAEASAREKHVLPLWRAAHRTAVAWGQYLEDRDQDPSLTAPLGLRMKHALFERVFFGRLRSVMGSRINYLLSGAATLRPELPRFFRGIGVPVIEGYGLTETTAPLTGGRPGQLVAGSVGTPIPGNAVRIAENGEVLAHGVGVFAGYRNSAHDADAFVDGYFRTGDLGYLNSAGALTLTGRLKHVIVTSTGRTISPERWESAVEIHPLVAHAALVGTDRPYLTALVVVDVEATREWFRERGDALPHALDTKGVRPCVDGRLTSEISGAIETANAAASPSERVQAWRAVVIGEDRAPEFITPTMKLKRQALLQEAAPIISELYS